MTRTQDNKIRAQASERWGRMDVFRPLRNSLLPTLPPPALHQSPILPARALLQLRVLRRRRSRQLRPAGHPAARDQGLRWLLRGFQPITPRRREAVDGSTTSRSPSETAGVAGVLRSRLRDTGDDAETARRSMNKFRKTMIETVVKATIQRRVMGERKMSAGRCVLC